MVRKSYSERIERFRVEEKRNRRHSLSYLWLKLIVFIACGFALYAIHPNYASPWIAIPIILFVAYVVFFILDAECCSRVKILRKKIEVCSHELAALDGDFSAFADGKEYIDSQHPFSIDLDIFGKDSLYQRINRTITQYGSDALARKMMKN